METKTKQDATDATLEDDIRIQVQSDFLFTFSCVCTKYGIRFPEDLDVDFEAATINVKTEMEDRKLLAFVAELEKIIGQLK